jgi:Mn2+/Fe2+ NRAMP family transporter
VGSLLDLTLGVVSATGGFIDIGELIFLTQAGAKFLFSLLWVVLIGTIGIIVYSEMAGRMAAVSGHTAFTAVRTKLGWSVGLVALVSSLLVTVITCAAEVGGMALIVEWVSTWPFWVCVLIAAILLLVLVAALPYSWIEKGLGILGLTMLVFLVSLFAYGAPWANVAAGLIPSFPGDFTHLALYGYFVVGIFAAVLMPYELIFYSSGAIEEKWSVKELFTNRIVSGVGYSFGSLVAFALLINAAVMLEPRNIDPQLLGATALQAIIPFGAWGAYLAMLGMFFAVTGAAVETSLSNGYMVCQFLGEPWGKAKSFRDAPLFHGIWAGSVVVGCIIDLAWQQPLQIAEVAVVFSVLALPLTYLAVLLAANDKAIMGKHVNGLFTKSAGVVFLVIITVVAIAAIPLLILTSMGEIW